MMKCVTLPRRLKVLASSSALEFLKNMNKELDIGYFKSSNQRKSIEPRSIKNRLVAWELDDKYYDGERANGYGGFRDDCRWDLIIPTLYKKFSIDLNGIILDLGCKKGFILEAFKRSGHLGRLIGIENHPYPLASIQNSSGIEAKCGPYYDIPLEDNSVDFSIAFSSIYMQTLGDVVRSLREIERVSCGRSYITLGAFEGETDKKIFSQWTLIGTTALSIQDWHEVIEYSGYSGYYFFTTPAVLGLY